MKWPDLDAPGRATSHGATRRARPNDAIREKMENGPPNMHKAPGQSQLSKTDTDALERNDPTQPEGARSDDLTQRDMARPTE